MKIWLIYKVAMAFRINIHGCQPYLRNSHLCTKSAQKPKLLLATVGEKFTSVYDSIFLALEEI